MAHHFIGDVPRARSLALIQRKRDSERERQNRDWYSASYSSEEDAGRDKGREDELSLPPYLPGAAAKSSCLPTEPLVERPWPSVDKPFDGLEQILRSAMLPCTHVEQRFTTTLTEARKNPKLVLRMALRHWGLAFVPRFESWQDSRGFWHSLQDLPEYGLRGAGGPRRTKADAEREASWTIVQQLRHWFQWL